MSPKQRTAVFIKAQATGQLKNHQTLTTYLDDWQTIKKTIQSKPHIFKTDPGFCIETQEDLDKALFDCQLIAKYKDILPII